MRSLDNVYFKRNYKSTHLLKDILRPIREALGDVWKPLIISLQLYIGSMNSQHQDYRHRSLFGVLRGLVFGRDDAFASQSCQ